MKVLFLKVTEINKEEDTEYIDIIMINLDTGLEITIKITTGYCEEMFVDGIKYMAKQTGKNLDLIIITKETTSEEDAYKVKEDILNKYNVSYSKILENRKKNKTSYVKSIVDSEEYEDL